MPERVYTKEEAEEILSRALELQGRPDATAHTDLVAAAREVGIPTEAIEKAASEVVARRRDDEDLRALRARKWRGFFAHLVPYLLVNTLLAFINVFAGGPPWVIIVMLAWGIGLGSHLFAAAVPDEHGLRRRLERERERARRREVRAVRVDAGDVRARVEPVKTDHAALDEADGDGPASERRRASR